MEFQEFTKYHREVASSATIQVARWHQRCFGQHDRGQQSKSADGRKSLLTVVNCVSMDVTQTLAKPPLNTWERNGNTTHRTSYQDISSSRSNIPNQTFQFSSSKIARHRTIASLRMTGVGTPMTPWRVPIGWEIKMPSNTCADWLQRSGVLTWEDLGRPGIWL